MKHLVIMATCLYISFTSMSFAAENRFQQFNHDVDTAYASYRKALFQTNKKDAEKSGKATGSFLKQWQTIVEAYGSPPPETFSTDPTWKDTLTGITQIATESAAMIEQDKLADAHEHLEAIRDSLSSLRQRNSVIVFSDHINNYHEVMEGLLNGGYTPDSIDDAALTDIVGKLAVLHYLAEAISENAPARYEDDNTYQQLQKGLFSSLDLLEQAVESGDKKKISTAVKMLKPAYAKLFVNFG